MSLVASECA